jgi:hypothetical protein
MKGLSKREVFMLMSLLLILSLAAYYQFYLKDILTEYAFISEERSDTINQINDAKVKQKGIDISEQKIMEIRRDLGEYDGTPLESFDRPVILRMLNTAVCPYVSDCSIAFSSGYRDEVTHHIYTVDLTFATTKNGFYTVLENLKKESLVNRVIETTLRLVGQETQTFQAGIAVEIMVVYE